MNNGASGGPPAVQFVTITADYQGQRIDNFLVTYLKGVPKSLIYKVLRKGEVRVNKGRSKPEYRLQAGDEIRLPPIRVTEARSPVLAGQRLLDLLKNRVL